LGWLADFDLVSIGMDVSLVNLRNAQRLTGALVVCGDATQMPFTENSFDLVTEASVLHHIMDYQSAVKEACRVCHHSGGIILDAEPSTDTMAFSKLAVAVFNLRFPVYKLLSYIQPDKYIFRDTEQAKLNLLAEIHHQPGKGFPLDTIRELFKQAGFKVHIIPAPTPTLESRATPNWQSIILNLLSFRSPWNPKYSPFTAITIPPTQSSGDIVSQGA
jgi:SAM-dependent methyltransferase